MIENEFELIDRLRRKLPTPSAAVYLGIGDDAAVLEPLTGKPILTVDSMVEGIHFDFSLSDPEEIGYKALAVNLSDIAAMGGTPRACLVSLGVPVDAKTEVLEKIYEGLGSLASSYSVDVVGGNITQSLERVFLSVTVLGTIEEKPLKRSGAKPGDVVFLSGAVGESAAGLAILKKLGRNGRLQYPELTKKHLLPDPHLKCARILAANPQVNCLIDVSDGLSSELWHLAKASGVGFTVREEYLPVSSELLAAGNECGESPKRWMLSGGEDYVLLGTVEAKQWTSILQRTNQAGCGLFKIGEVASSSPEVSLINLKGTKESVSPSGWNHLMHSRKGLT